jgi:hypothetical protein
MHNIPGVGLAAVVDHGKEGEDAGLARGPHLMGVCEHPTKPRLTLLRQPIIEVEIISGHLEVSDVSDQDVWGRVQQSKAPLEYIIE